jgi:hypothetical protein
MMKLPTNVTITSIIAVSVGPQAEGDVNVAALNHV